MQASYYHWTSWDIDQLKVGMELETSWEISNYWSQKLEMNGPRLELPDELKNIPLEELKNFLPDELKNLLADESEDDIHAIRYKAELKKEDIFEQLRSEQFPNLPSRRVCVFAIDELLDPIEFGSKIGLYIDACNLIKIAPVVSESVVHQANMSLLNCNSLSSDEIRNNALKYWQGESSPSFDTEVLIQGKFTIAEIVNRHT